MGVVVGFLWAMVEVIGIVLTRQRKEVPMRQVLGGEGVVALESLLKYEIKMAIRFKLLE